MTDGQLWSKQLPLDRLIHDFTVGDDNLLDMQLIGWDLLGTAAHVRMLLRQDLLAAEDAAAILDGLRAIRIELGNNEFAIGREQEDCHTAIEQALQRICPAAAGSVHLGRSRNDQVLTALRLYMKHAAYSINHMLLELATQLNGLATDHMSLLMPGYTHLRRAMPSSVGRWLLAFSAGLLEESHAARGLLERLDSSPLGSGAGFGLPLPLDREYSAGLLGFSRVQLSEIDCANSRGRHELALAGWISLIGNQLEKLVWDLCLYSTEEFRFVSLPDEFTTGSSIMPQKRNPDVLELMRARTAQLRAWRNELEQVHCGLPSNYHRDYQLLKPALFSSVSAATELLRIAGHVVAGLQFNEARLRQACSNELFSTEEAYRLVQHEGVPFRQAYRLVGRELLEGRHVAGFTSDNWRIPEGWLADARALASQLAGETERNSSAFARFMSQLGKLLD